MRIVQRRIIFCRCLLCMWRMMPFFWVVLKEWFHHFSADGESPFYVESCAFLITYVVVCNEAVYDVGISM